MMAVRVTRPSTAFSLDKPKRETRGRKAARIEAHRKWIASLPSLITGSRINVDCAHVSYADPSVGKTTRGKAQKADDFFTVPLSRGLHDEQHEIGELRFWRKYAVDPIRVALALYANSGDDEAGEAIVRETIRGRRDEAVR